MQIDQAIFESHALSIILALTAGAAGSVFLTESKWKWESVPNKYLLWCLYTITEQLQIYSSLKTILKKKKTEQLQNLRKKVAKQIN